MTTACQVASYTYSRATAADDCSVELVRVRIELAHLTPRTDRDGAAVDLDVAAAGAERVVHGHALHVVRPNG